MFLISRVGATNAYRTKVLFLYQNYHGIFQTHLT